MYEQSVENRPVLEPTLPRWWRVLPSLLLIVIITTIDILILNDFIEYRYTTYYQVNSSSTPNTRELCLNVSRTSHNSTILISTTTSKYPISTTISPNDLIQASTARLNVFISLAATIPAILTSILLGTNCDRIGRKPLIALPFMGKTIRYFILTAVAYYNLADLWIILAVMFDSAFGTVGLSLLSSYAYVSDCTSEKARTRAIIITDVCMNCSRCIPLLAMGIYLENPDFIQSMVFTLLLSVGGLIFSVVLQPESNLNVQHLNFLQQLRQIKFGETTKMFRVFLLKRENHKQRSLLMLISAHLCIITMAFGFLSINYLYLYGAPFCFDSFGVSLTTTTQVVTMVLLTIPFTLTIRKRIDHLALPMLGSLALMTQLILYGIVNQHWMIYLAVCIGSLFNVLIPIIRSRITKLVEPNEYACVFILASIFESGGSFAISAMANEIYRISLTFYSGLVFFVLAMFGGMAIILML
jgi:hypothetical protein